MDEWIDQYRPIFILSCERSGSTLLRVIMDTHSQIACPGQLYLGPSCRYLYNMIYYSLGQRFSGPENERITQVLKEVRGTVGAIMQRYASARNKRLWCEKTTLNVDYLDILSDVFPNARYVCLYRNCMDVVQSCLKFSSLGFMVELAPYVSKDPGNLVSAMAESWLEKSKKILEFENSNKTRCFRIHYEDIVTNPEANLSAMFKFLDVEWEVGILNKIFAIQHDQGDGDVNVHFSKEISKDSIGKGRSIPRSALPDHLQIRVNELHHELGFASIDQFYRDLYTVPAAEGSVGRLDIGSFFESELPAILLRKQQGIGNLTGLCQMIVGGDHGAKWVVDFSNGNGEIRKAIGDQAADCTIDITYSAFRDLVNGSTSVRDVYERGEVSVRGSEHLAMQFGKLLFG